MPAAGLREVPHGDVVRAAEDIRGDPAAAGVCVVQAGDTQTRAIGIDVHRVRAVVVESGDGGKGQGVAIAAARHVDGLVVPLPLLIVIEVGLNVSVWFCTPPVT